MENEIISLREFARRLGVGEKTIRDGIKNGKIAKGVTYVDGKPKINFIPAKDEAEEISLGQKILVRKEAIEIIDSTKNAPQKVVVKTKPLKKDSVKVSGKIKEVKNEVELLSLVNAVRVKENFLAKIKELEYEEKKASLVSRKEVFAQQYELGAKIRNLFETLPGRVISKMASCGNDESKMNLILSSEIASTLRKVIEDLSDNTKVC